MRRAWTLGVWLGLGLAAGCGDDGEGPSAEVVFPSLPGFTDVDSITIRGVITDGDPASVRAGEAETTTFGETGGFSLAVPLSTGPNLLELETRGSDGARAAAATVEVELARPRVEAPSHLTFDAANARLIFGAGQSLLAVDVATRELTELSGPRVGAGPEFGRVTSVVVDAAGSRYLVADVPGRVVAVDMATGDRSVHSADGVRGLGDPLASPADLALDAALGRLLVLDGGGAIFAVDLENGDRTILSSPTVGTGDPFGTVLGMAFDPAGGAIYVSNTVRSAFTLVGSIVVVDPSTGNRAPLPAGSGPALERPAGLALDAPGGRLFAADVDGDAIVEVEIATGARSSVVVNDATGSDALPSPFGVAHDPSGFVYVGDLGRSRVLGVELGSSEVTALAGASAGTGPGLESARGLAFDPATRELFALKSGGSALVAIDSETGARRLVSGASVGAGLDFISPVGLAIHPTTGNILVLGHTSAILFEVDRETGDRSIFTGSIPGDMEIANARGGPAVDVEGNRLFYATYAFGAGVYEVPLDTGVETEISTGGPEAGPELVEPRAVAYAGGLVYAADSGLGAIVSVDPSTGLRAIVADASTGAGPAILDPMAMFADAGHGRIYLVDEGHRAIVGISLETGDREILAGEARGAGPAFDEPNGLHVDVATERAFVVDQGALFEVDLTTGDRLIVGR